MGGSVIYFFSAYQNSSRQPNVRDVNYDISEDSAVCTDGRGARFRADCGSVLVIFAGIIPSSSPSCFLEQKRWKQLEFPIVRTM
jgi:hypothetical protein